MSLATEMETSASVDVLTDALEFQLSHPATSPDVDLHQGVDQVLADIGMTSADSGGKLTFYGRDPILPSRLRFGTMAGIGLAARSVALAALWRQATGEGQDISLDVRKARGSLPQGRTSSGDDSAGEEAALIRPYREGSTPRSPIMDAKG